MELCLALDNELAEDMGYTLQGEPIGEIALWRAVLVRAVKDACGIDNVTPLQVRYAQRWVGLKPSSDFKRICSWAALDPDAVHFAVLDFITQPARERRNLGRNGRPAGSKAKGRGCDDERLAA